MTDDAMRAAAPQRLAILGAGPVGLDAALAAVDAGWPFTVYESADRVGGNVARWAHVKLFTPWSVIVSERMARHLRAAGIEPRTDDHIPTGAEVLAELLEPLAGLPELAGHIVCGARVIGVGRDGLLKHEEIGSAERAARPFRILLRRNGIDATDSADLVFDCTGTHATPNAAGDGGLPAPGEEELGDRIAHWLPDLVRDRDAWAGRTILLIGSGYGAQTAARDLAALLPSAPGTQVIWAVRHAKPTWGEAEGDPFPERQGLVDSAKWIAAGNVPGLRVEVGTAVDAFKPEGDRILVRLRGSAQREIVVDRVLALTGYVPDNSIYRQLQMHECYATTAPMNLAAQLLGASGADCVAAPSYGVETLRSPEPNFFVLGAKSYGRNSLFLAQTGYDQVSIVTAAYEPST